MGTLLLRLAAPLQSWGEDSKFETRRTRREPTKSGVIGLLAAALGRRRDEPLDDLKSLRFAVRVDQEGELLRDFHTASNAKSNYLTERYYLSGTSFQEGKLPRGFHMAREEETDYVTERYYLSDAVFLAGLESGDEEFLRKLDAALRAPAFPLFLGRRSCPPTPPLSLGVTSEPLEKALTAAPRQTPEWRRRFDDASEASLRAVFDADPGACGAARLKDLPVSFSPKRRQYAYRACEERLLSRQKQEENDVQGSQEP